MSIPLDRLYHYIEDTAQDIRGQHVLIYRFFPHGSKKIEDLTILGDFRNRTYIEKMLIPYIYCHDQEPLHYNLYKDYKQPSTPNDHLNSLVEKYNINLAPCYFPMTYHNIYDQSLLIHSEQRSFEVEKYRADNFIPVYYWSHAIISLDWFRYAEHTTQKKLPHNRNQLKFLVYNRAWSGTREYRLKFADLIIQSGLVNCCQLSVNPIEPELNIHYNQHQFTNSLWRPVSVLEQYLPVSNAPSYFSADFDMLDYNNTDIEVVLETLFDDTRLHLTEKSLRPIACGQPFIISSTVGSLEYLRRYGFKTFGHIWDEHYDLIKDPYERLVAIVDLMKQITNWDPVTKEYKMIQAQAIADYNKKHFFSSNFFTSITDELKNNLQIAFTQLEDNNTSQLWFSRRKKLFKENEIRDFLLYNSENHYKPLPKREGIMKVVSTARKYYLRSLKGNHNK